MRIDLAIAELKEALSPGQSCHIEADLAQLIERDFNLDARIARAIRNHRKRSHLIKFKREMTRQSLAAA